MTEGRWDRRDGGTEGRRDRRDGGTVGPEGRRDGETEVGVAGWAIATLARVHASLVPRHGDVVLVHA